jgi:radical SAM superfamily enzyme YgiQ (UPF0313 family)
MKVLFIRNSCLLMSHSQLGYGIGIVATITHNAGHTVRVIDNNTLYRNYALKDFLREIERFDPDVIAYGMTMHNAYETYQQVAVIKRRFPGKPIVAGGIHMRYCYEEALRRGVDVVVNRDGELVILPLLEHLAARGADFRAGLDEIKGVSFLDDGGELHSAAEFPTTANLDEIPLVNYHLFNLADFIKTGSEPGVFFVVGQRGCPFHCTFCSDEVQREDQRMASAEWLFNNVRDLHDRYGVRYLLLADNNITLSRKRLVEFCERIIASGLHREMTFSCQTTTRFSLDDALVALMKQAGFARINFGLERLTPDSLRMINKEQPLENVHQVLKLVARHGIDPSIFMMIGFPFETVELLRQERELFLGLTGYTRRLFLSVLSPVPGTIYYDDNPGVREWYLNEKEQSMLRAYFTNVLDMHTFHVINKNFFNLAPEVLAEERNYYLTFKNISYGSVFTVKSLALTVLMKLDFAVAHLSRITYSLSPPLESLLFSRLKAVRYYAGNRLFGKNIYADRREVPDVEA